MKKITVFLVAVCSVFAGINAQTWTAPQVPGADLTSLKSTEVVYMYNVDADVFLINGMDWNTNACTTRLTKGDTSISEPHRCYATVSSSNVNVRLLSYPDNHISCPSTSAFDVYVDQNSGYQFRFTETEAGSKVYTLRNTTHSKILDLAWPTGGHLTLTNGAGATRWAFIPQTSITNSNYAKYKARKQLYNVYKAINEDAKISNQAEAIATAKNTYDNASATVAQLQTAAKALFNAAYADIEGPLDVSFLFTNADMAGMAKCTGWISASQTIDWGEFEKYHASITLTQKQTVPQGLYDVRFHSLYRQDGTNAAPTLTATAENTVKVDIPLMDKLNFLVSNSNSNNWSAGEEYIRPNGMQSAAQALCHPDAYANAENVVVGENGTLTITARMSSTTQWLNWQGMSIIYKGLGTGSVKAELTEVIEAAKALYGDGSGKGASQLKEVIDQAETLNNSSTATIAQLVDMKAQLTEAMEAYRLSNVSIDNPLDWSDRIENRSFEKGFTGWANVNMQTQSNSSFGLKAGNMYVEKWVSVGTPVGDASVTQVIRNLDMGIYILKAVGHNIQEGNATTQTGAWIIANNSRTEINRDADYSLIFTNIEKNATIGLEAIGATGNWLVVDNFRLYYAGGEFADFRAELQRYVDEAQPFLNEYMQNSAKTALQKAIDDALVELGKTSADGYPSVATQIRSTLQGAKNSIKAFEDLKAAIQKAETAYGDGSKNGADKFMVVINNAKSVYADLNTTQAEMTNQIVLLEKAELQYNLDNASGTTPKVTTDKRYARGAVAAFGRMTVSGIATSNILEQGFCYSTHPDPTVLDERTTNYLEQNGKIYVMDMKPATVYYIRAYAMTKNYQVGYGDVIKMSTLPMGNVTWSYNNAGDDTHTSRVETALAEACYYWSNYTSINGFHVSCTFSPGTPTADCGYGGNMRIGTNGGQRTGTCMHEMNHGIGGGTIPVWGGFNESPLRVTINGDWAGERANAVLQFWENRNDLLITAAYDGAHWGFRPLSGVYEEGGGNTAIWENKYAFNGAHLEPGAWAGPKDWNGTQIVYIGNSLINQAMCEDGLVPVNYYGGAFCLPAYVFEHDEQKKYYIKCENKDLGLYDSYLVEDAGGKLKWIPIESSEIAGHEEAAWYVTFTPNNQYYQIHNAKTGHYVSYSSNNFVAANKTTITSNENFHVMRGRKGLNVGGVNVRGYWLLHPENSNAPHAITATANGNISSLSLNHYDSGDNQRWIFMEAESIETFEQGTKKALQTDLRNFIAQIRRLEKVPHNEDMEGTDANLESELTRIEGASAAAATPNEVHPLVDDARQAAMTFLQNVTPQNVDTPFDITFMMDNPAIDDNSGWSDSPTFSNSCCEYFQMTFDYNQTLKNMPKGTYKLTNQAFQRPGDYTTAYNNYAAGRNNVNAVVYINTTTNRICHIAQDASAKQVHSEDVTVGSSLYIPNTMASAAAYFNKKLYNNEVVAEMNTQGGNVKVGIRGTVANSGYWTIFDNFHLYYYGTLSKETVTGIDEISVETDTQNTAAPVYNLQGIYMGTSIDDLPTGVYIQNGRKIYVK